MPSKRISKINSRMNYEMACHLGGYCPTSKEIENSKIKKMANRLKAESYKETLTNILEWQDRNIEFWTERHPISTLLKYICLIFAGTLVVFSVGFLVSIILLTRLSSQIVALVWFIQMAVWLAQNIWWFISIFACSTLTILAAMISILHSNRKLPWTEIPRGLKNIFAPSISMNFLLGNKLGVCRDYAKLTACLLSNIYPNAEIYFASAPDHVATGINIENRLYMLDQHLPILTKDRWNDYRKPKKSGEIERFDPTKKTLQADKKTFPQTKDKSELNVEKLAKKMTELLNIKEQPDDKTISLQKPIPWKNGAILYEDNEIVNYSLARRLKAEFSGEMFELSQIAKLEAIQDKNDLIFRISSKPNK